MYEMEAVSPNAVLLVRSLMTKSHPYAYNISFVIF